MGHIVTWARAYGLCRDSAFRRYVARIARRPAFAAAFADAHEFTPVVPERAGIGSLFTG
jgi:glutathione S-transferase